MKIKEIANNIELHKTEDGLALMSNNKVLLQGFTDIGTLANGLVPIIYYKQQQQQFKYLDTDTLEIFDISNVNWISGFHYVGSNLTYLGHNYRTDPLNKLSISYKYSSVEGMKPVFENLDGCEMMLKPERKFNEDLQKMLETGVNKMQCTLTPELAQKLFNEIKYSSRSFSFSVLLLKIKSSLIDKSITLSIYSMNLVDFPTLSHSDNAL